MTRWVAAIIGLTVLAGGRSSPAQEPLKEIVFLTNYVFLGRHAPFFVGLEKGFYREAGFDIEILPSTGSGSVIAALEGGQADYGIAETAPFVQAVAKGAGIKAFGVYMDESTSGLASLTPYQRPESIAGKPIAASVTDSARVILPIIYHLEGLDPSTLIWQAADPSVYFPLLLQGRAELVTASIDSDVPTLRRATEPRGLSVHFASFAEWGYDVFGYLLVARTDRIASRPEEIRAFAAATTRAVRYAVDHPEEAVEILVEHNPTLDRGLMRTQWNESIAAIDTAFVKEHGYGRATRERLVRSIELVTAAFELDAKLTPDDVYVDGFVSH
ncbi:MAG TPA: ABC transporter substrate-binding protein [Vicinamibacteria bacterium]|nr:ABC transporter substrate-binding protein [Vicinamibacteria bacterium]